MPHRETSPFLNAAFTKNVRKNYMIATKAIKAELLTRGLKYRDIRVTGMGLPGLIVSSSALF